jgi:hypothetical protein
MMRSVEGGSAESAMRILRHEAGHAIDTAYRLRRLKRWRDPNSAEPRWRTHHIPSLGGRGGGSFRTGHVP